VRWKIRGGLAQAWERIAELEPWLRQTRREFIEAAVQRGAGQAAAAVAAEVTAELLNRLGVYSVLEPLGTDIEGVVRY